MKFLQSGDYHLGRSFFSMPPHLAKIRREELWQALEGQVKICLENQIDYLFITGDLFDKEKPSLKNLNRFLDLVKDLPHVLVLRGNHDYQLSLPPRDNLYVFQGTESFNFPQDRLRVHGQSWQGPQAPKLEDLADLEVLEGGLNICLLHGDFKKKDLEDQTFLQAMDYLALGHIHKPGKLGDRAYYAGSPEPFDSSDLGERGYILGDLPQGDIQFIPANARSYHRIEIEDKLDLAQDLLDKLSLNHKDFYQVILKGPVDSNLRLDLIEDYFSKQGYQVQLENRGLDLGRIQAYQERGDVFTDLLKQVLEGVENKDLDSLYLQELLSIYEESLEE